MSGCIEVERHQNADKRKKNENDNRNNAEGFILLILSKNDAKMELINF